MQIYCPTPNALLLLIRRDEKGIYQAFAGESSALPGLSFVAQQGIAIQPQLVEIAEKRTGVALPPTAFEIMQEVAFPLLHDNKNYTLYVLQILTSVSTSACESNTMQEAAVGWKALPLLLREMPATKSRVAYLKVWQFMAGVAQQEIRVVEK